MPYFLSPVGNDQQCDANGNPLVGGKIYTYLAGTNTPAATFTDSTSGTQQANPIILSSLGLPASPIWQSGGIPLKYVIKDSADVLIRTIDNISGVNDSSSTVSEWTDSGFLPTYISGTQFSVQGDQTAIFQVNRRVRTKNTAGYVYGRVTASVYAANITTVTVLNDSGAIDAGISFVAYGFLSFSPSSIPYALYAGAGANTDITSLGALASPIGLVPSLQGSFKNLQASATGSNANVSVSADEIVVESASNTYQTLRSVSLTIAGTSVGANALDTGTIAASTWYSVWVIWNGTTTAGLLSLSATAPTMPSGYTHKTRVGWIRTDGTANKYPLRFFQFGRRVRYSVGGNVANSPVMGNGSAGNVSTPTFVAVAIGAYVPSTAAQIIVALACSNANCFATCAQNGNYGLVTASNTPPIVAGTSAGNVVANCVGDLPIESGNIYWNSNGGAAALLWCLGWEDNL